MNTLRDYTVRFRAVDGAIITAGPYRMATPRDAAVMACELFDAQQRAGKVAYVIDDASGRLHYPPAYVVDPRDVRDDVERCDYCGTAYEPDEAPRVAVLLAAMGYALAELRKAQAVRGHEAWVNAVFNSERELAAALLAYVRGK